jgi:hypothetical protein
MINPVGYIKIHRELAAKPIWESSTVEQKVILITLLLMANFNEKQWEWKGQKFIAKPGQFVTSLDNIVKNAGSGISIKNVRTALKRFENLEFLANESTKTGRLITIINWEVYQCEEERVAKQPAKTGQRGGKDLAPREEGKKDKKVIKEKNSDFLLQDIVKNYPGRKVKKVRDKKLPKLIEQYGEEQIRHCIDRYAEDCRLNPWRGILNESTFWTTRHVEFLDEFYKGPTADRPGKASPVDQDKVRAERQAERIRARLKKSRGETDEGSQSD